MQAVRNTEYSLSLQYLHPIIHVCIWAKILLTYLVNIARSIKNTILSLTPMTVHMYCTKLVSKDILTEMPTMPTELHASMISNSAN